MQSRDACVQNTDKGNEVQSSKTYPRSTASKRQYWNLNPRVSACYANRLPVKSAFSLYYTGFFFLLPSNQPIGYKLFTGVVVKETW